MNLHPPAVDVRRLAAIDMHALRGTDTRRRVILAEFVLGAIAGIGIGIFLLLSAAGALGSVLGAWALGIGVNYVPLRAAQFRLVRAVGRWRMSGTLIRITVPAMASPKASHSETLTPMSAATGPQTASPRG